MSRIEIDSDGRRVVVDHDADLSLLSEAALSIWEKTEPAKRMSAGYAGFSMERAHQWDHDRQPPVRVKEAE